VAVHCQHGWPRCHVRRTEPFPGFARDRGLAHRSISQIQKTVFMVTTAAHTLAGIRRHSNNLNTPATALLQHLHCHYAFRYGFYPAAQYSHPGWALALPREITNSATGTFMNPRLGSTTCCGGTRTMAISAHDSYSYVSRTRLWFVASGQRTLPIRAWCTSTSVRHPVDGYTDHSPMDENPKAEPEFRASPWGFHLVLRHSHGNQRVTRYLERPRFV